MSRPGLLLVLLGIAGCGGDPDPLPGADTPEVDFFVLGQREMARRRWDRAEDAFEIALARDPEHVDAWYELAGARLRLGNPGKAAAAATEAVRLDPTWADAHHRLGVALARDGRGAEGMERFREAIRLDPDHAGARFELGGLLLELGRLDEVKEQLDRLWDLDRRLWTRLEGMRLDFERRSR